MKKYILFPFTLIWFNFMFSQGYVPETFNSVENFENYSKEGFGFADDIPSAKSLVKYVPPIGNQKQTGSCVAWATTYYNISIIYNRTYGITTFRDKFSHSFDPWYTYSMVNRYRNNSSDCNEGLSMSDAMSFLEVVGPKKLFLPPKDISCSASFSEENIEVISRYSSPYRITKIEKEIATNFDPYNNPMSNSVVNKVKTEIGKYSFPVVAGFRNYGSTLNNVGSSGYWYPSYQNNSGGHAMTIVGYDDYKNGGSFLVVNSWGYDWGNNGYAWIRYSDFKRFCDIVLFTWISPNHQSESPQIKNLPNYTRNKANSETRIYEGEKNSSGYTGYGIVSFLEDDSHYAGWFDGGNMNGFFRVIDSDGYWAIEYKNGTPISTSKLGFAENQKNLEKIKETNNYIKTMFPEVRFRESQEEDNSSRVETIQ